MILESNVTVLVLSIFLGILFILASLGLLYYIKVKKSHQNIALSTEKAEKIAELNRMNNSGDKFTRENLNANLGKGAIEAGAMFGSVTGLAILAPIISHPLIHPIMNALFPDEQHKKV